MDTASSRKMEDKKKDPVKLEEKLNRLEKEFCFPRVLIRTVSCRSDIEGDLNKATQQLKEFKDIENPPVQGSPQRSENNWKGRLNPPNTLPKPKNRVRRGQNNNFLENDTFLQDDGLPQLGQATGGREKDQFRSERGKGEEDMDRRSECPFRSSAQTNETCRSYDDVDFGDEEEIEQNRSDLGNQGRSGDNLYRGRGRRGMRHLTQGLSTEIESQGTVTRENEEGSIFEPNKLLVCGLSETTTSEEVLNFIEVISDEEVQKVQMSKGKALVTMTKDITSK